MFTMTAGTLFIQADSWVFSTPSITFDTFCKVTGAPLRYAMTTCLKSAAVVI